MAALATKAELKAEQGKTKKLQAFDLSYFIGKVILKKIHILIENSKYLHCFTFTFYLHETNKNLNISSHPILKNCLFGALILTKNVEINKYPDPYSAYGIGFDRKGTFSVSNGSDRNCIIYGVDMSSSVRVENKKKNVLILHEGPTQRLDCTSLTAKQNVFS